MTIGEILDLYNAISNVSSRLAISKAFGIRSIKTLDNYLTAVRQIRNRCAHNGVLFDYVASMALTEKGPVKMSSVADKTNLRGAIEVIKYLTGVVSKNRQSDFEQEIRRLIERYKEEEPHYWVIQIASGF